jgi:ketosteroid isomerase-like protein
LNHIRAKEPIMAKESKREGAAIAMRRINQAWLDGQVDDLAPLVHPDVVMVLPGFSGRIQGRDELLAGFRDFCRDAKLHEFREHDHLIDVAGATAVVSFRYEMVYERSGERYRATGRDLWVFEDQAGVWIAVWRTMLELEETPA